MPDLRITSSLLWTMWCQILLTCPAPRPRRGQLLGKMGARFITETSFTVPNGAAGYPPTPTTTTTPTSRENVPRTPRSSSAPGTRRWHHRRDPQRPDADGSVTYTVALTPRPRCATALPRPCWTTAPSPSWAWAAALRALACWTPDRHSVRPAAGRGQLAVERSVPGVQQLRSSCAHRPSKKYSDAPVPREDPCQQVRPLTSYTLDDGRTCRLGFAEVGSWDFGETTGGQGNANGKTWALFINKSTMHGVLQIKVDAGYDDLVLYYNAQGFDGNDAFSYDLWAGDGEDGAAVSG